MNVSYKIRLLTFISDQNQKGQWYLNLALRGKIKMTFSLNVLYKIKYTIFTIMTKTNDRKKNCFEKNKFNTRE